MAREEAQQAGRRNPSDRPKVVGDAQHAGERPREEHGIDSDVGREAARFAAARELDHGAKRAAAGPDEP